MEISDYFYRSCQNRQKHDEYPWEDREPWNRKIGTRKASQLTRTQSSSIARVQETAGTENPPDALRTDESQDALRCEWRHWRAGVLLVRHTGDYSQRTLPNVCFMSPWWKSRNRSVPRDSLWKEEQHELISGLYNPAASIEAPSTRKRIRIQIYWKPPGFRRSSTPRIVFSCAVLIVFLPPVSLKLKLLCFIHAVHHGCIKDKSVISLPSGRTTGGGGGGGGRGGRGGWRGGRWKYIGESVNRGWNELR